MYCEPCKRFLFIFGRNKASKESKFFVFSTFLPARGRKLPMFQFAGVMSVFESSIIPGVCEHHLFANTLLETLYFETFTYLYELYERTTSPSNTLTHSYFVSILAKKLVFNFHSQFLFLYF